MALRRIGHASIVHRPPPGPGGEGEDGRRVILYVEDNDDNWEVTRLQLDRHFRLLRARDDREACALVGEHGKDIIAVLMDIELQGSRLDGTQITRLLKGKPGLGELPDYALNVPIVDVPIFFVTAYRNRYSDQELREAGGDKIFAKPVDFPGLADALLDVQGHRGDTTATDLLSRIGEGALSPVPLLERLGQDPSEERRFERIRSELSSVLAMPPSLRDLDVDALRTISVVSVTSAMARARAQPHVFMGVLFRRGMAAAMVADKHGSVSPVAAFGLGALLDIGVLAHAQYDEEGALKVIRSPALTRPLRERATGTGSHPERGVTLARGWGLPDPFLRAIAGHHGERPPNAEIERVAWLAERLVAPFESGDPETQRTAFLQGCAASGLTAPVSAALLEGFPSRVNALSAQSLFTFEPCVSLAERRSDWTPAVSTMQAMYDDLVAELAEVVRAKVELANRFDQARRRHEEASMVDALTGLLNRRGFEVEFHRDLARARRMKVPLSLIAVDIDHFKQVNDSHGHGVGDAVLAQVAKILFDSVRASDVVARVGGEEFLFSCLDTPCGSARDVAERIRKRIASARIQTAAGPVPVTASFGVTVLGSSDEPETAMERADAALYAAKRAGRNCTEVLEPESSQD